MHPLSSYDKVKKKNNKETDFTLVYIVWIIKPKQDVVTNH